MVPLANVALVLVAFGQIAVEGGPGYSERPADGGGGFPVALHPASEGRLVGIELGGATELAARLADVFELEGGAFPDARYGLGRPGWRDDVRRGPVMARSTDPLSYAMVVTYLYVPGIPYGVLRPDDSAVREIEDALQIAERSSDDLALAITQMALGLALVHRHTAAEHDRGQTLLADVGDVFIRPGHNLCDLPIVKVYSARERARRGDRDDAIPLMRAAVDDLFREGQLLAWGVPATGVLVETLLDRSADGDVAEAEAAIERLAAAPTDDGLVVGEVTLLRLRALLARARGDEARYREYRDHYRDMAKTLGFEGHIAWAEAMS